MIKHYSQNIQNVIQRELFAAKRSIKICVAWFTNNLLFQPLILKLNMGVQVEIILNKDEINLSDSNEVDFDEFIANGGCLYWNNTNKLLHHKFCIIDDRVVISGSYNWTNKAEFNYEDITVSTEDSDSLSHYQKIFEKLSQEFPVSKSHIANQRREISYRYQLSTYSIKYTSTDGKIVDIACNESEVGVKIISNTYQNGQGEIILDREIKQIGTANSSEQHLTFPHCKTLQSVIIPDFVTKIERGAFRDCINLARITIPDSVTIVGDSAFSGCSSLESITIPHGVTKIGECAFHGCNSLKSIVIPNSVTKIGNGTFYYCSSLTSVTIPNGVTEIGKNTFTGCSSLKTINIPNSVTKIEDSAFWGCSSLESITIPHGVTKIGENAFHSCNSLKSIVIPNRVTKIGNSTFYGCSLLTSVTIPNGVTEIENRAFWGCKSLKNINIPNSVTKIEDSAFWGCSSLENIIIPDSVTEVGYQVFANCQNLTKFEGKFSADYGRCLIINGRLAAFALNCGFSEYTIPNTVVSIDSHVFDGNKDLTTLYISENVQRIGVNELCSLNKLVFESIVPPYIQQ